MLELQIEDRMMTHKTRYHLEALLFFIKNSGTYLNCKKKKKKESICTKS